MTLIDEPQTTTNSATPAEHELPWIISVDDHILEPATCGRASCRPSLRDRGPRVVAREGRSSSSRGGHYGVRARRRRRAVVRPLALRRPRAAHRPAARGRPASRQEEQRNVPAIYEDFRPGTYDQTARLADMDANHVEARSTTPTRSPASPARASPSGPTRTSRCACVQIYNDWMIDEWCGGAGRGRLIPLTLVPLWDPQLAADEVRRCAAKGSHAIAFSREPVEARLPVALHAARGIRCGTRATETDTTVSMHIGSSSSMPTTCARRAARHVDVAQRAERRRARCATGSSPARSSASPS